MKKKWGKLLAAALSASMVLSMAACGKKDEKPSSTSAGKTSKVSSTTSGDQASQTGSQEEGSKISSSMASETQPSGEIVNLKWVFLGGGVPANLDAWKEELNKYLAEKIGVNIDFEYGTWDNWGEKRSTSLNTGGDYDIMFTDAGSYVKDVHNGAFLDITELLATNAPELKNFIPENYWNAVKVDGGIHAVPTYKDSSRTDYFIFDKEMVEKYKIDLGKVSSLKDLDAPLLEMAKGEKQAPFIMNKDGLSGITDLKYDTMGLIGLGVKYGASEKKLVPIFEQPEVMEDFKLLHK